MSKRPLLITGYPRWTIDLFVECTNALYTVVDGLLSNLPAHIVSGLVVTTGAGGTFNVAAGIVYVDGKVRRFAGATNVALPITLTAPNAPTATDPRPLYAGGTANTAEVHDAVVNTSGGGGLVVEASPRRNYIWAMKQALGWDSKADQSELEKLKRGAWQNLTVQNNATVPGGEVVPGVARTGGVAPGAGDAVQVFLRGTVQISDWGGGVSPLPAQPLGALPADCAPIAAAVALRIPLPVEYFDGTQFGASPPNGYLEGIPSATIHIAATTGVVTVEGFDAPDYLRYPWAAVLRLDGLSFWR